MTHLVSRDLWESVGQVLERGVSTALHRLAVEQARKDAGDDDFVRYILPQCHEDEREEVMTHLVSRGLWRSVGQVLERGVSTAQHRWVVEQASEHAGDHNFADYIVPQCHEEELEEVMTHLVSRDLWRSVGGVLERGVSTAQHRWVVEQAIKHAGDDDFVRYILPQCHRDEREEVMTHLVSRGLWRSVGQVLERGVSTAQHRSAVEQASICASERQIADYILPACSEEELGEVSRHMVSRGLWKPVDSVTHSEVTITQHVLSQLVSRGLWEAVGRFVQRNISREQHKWAVEQASKHADDDDFVGYILPQCHGEEEEEVMTHLVSRGLWESVGEVLERGVSTAQHRWAVEQAIKHAADDNFVRYILPQCHGEEEEEVMTHLVSRGLWWLVGQELERGVSTAQHRWAVEQAIKHAGDVNFAYYILPQRHGEEREEVMTHRVSRGLWWLV
ncbi:hypothetical protein ACOMHN_052183 [Nucella lapillus]